MLAISSRQVGAPVVLLAKKQTDCALQVTNDFILDDGTDLALEKFLNSVDIVTIENEFIDLERFKIFSEKIFPSFENLKLIQSKLDQKKFLKKNKIPSLEFEEIQNPSDFEKVYNHFQGKLVLKQARFG